MTDSTPDPMNVAATPYATPTPTPEPQTGAVEAGRYQGHRTGNALKSIKAIDAIQGIKGPRAARVVMIDGVPTVVSQAPNIGEAGTAQQVPNEDLPLMGETPEHWPTCEFPGCKGEGRYKIVAGSGKPLSISKCGELVFGAPPPVDVYGMSPGEQQRALVGVIGPSGVVGRIAPKSHVDVCLNHQHLPHAPSKPKPRTNAIDPDLAIPFVRESFPGMFPNEPAVSLPQEGVRFSADPDGSSMSGFAWVWATGRVDLAVDIALDCGPNQRFTIPIMEVLLPITLMATAVSAPGYARVYGKTRTGLPRRFDWFIAVSTNFLRPDNCTVQWDGITFPGRCPPRAGSMQTNFCPTGGYASDRLQNWKVGSPVSVLLATFLEDFLKQNGYHDVADAVADTITEATTPQIAVERAASLSGDARMLGS